MEDIKRPIQDKNYCNRTITMFETELKIIQKEDELFLKHTGNKFNFSKFVRDALNDEIFLKKNRKKYGIDDNGGNTLIK